MNHQTALIAIRNAFPTIKEWNGEGFGEFGNISGFADVNGVEVEIVFHVLSKCVELRFNDITVIRQFGDDLPTAIANAKEKMGALVEFLAGLSNNPNITLQHTTVSTQNDIDPLG